MMRQGRIYLLCCLLSGLLFACKKSEVDSTVYDAGYTYFPVNTGHEIVYDVDSVIYDDFKDTVVTYKFQKRILIGDTFTALDGKINQRLEWYTRQNDTLPWELRRVGSCLRTSLTAEVVEDNQRLIKLLFPVMQGKSWDGYAYTTIKDEPNFYYDKTNLTYTGFNGQKFLNTIMVAHQDDSNLIEVRRSFEQYAPGVGLVYVKFDSLDTQFDTWGNPVTRGLRYSERIRSFVK